MERIFENRPTQWGLRGDPFLWDDMKKHFSDIPFPDNELDFSSMIHSAFYELTGEQLNSEKIFFIKKYDQGGMSSGMIEPNYWLEIILPMLLNRFREIKQ